jgi:hypothetical protein
LLTIPNSFWNLLRAMTNHCIQLYPS